MQKKFPKTLFVATQFVSVFVSTAIFYYHTKYNTRFSPSTLVYEGLNIPSTACEFIQINDLNIPQSSYSKQTTLPINCKTNNILA